MKKARRRKRKDMATLEGLDAVFDDKSKKASEPRELKIVISSSSNMQEDTPTRDLLSRGLQDTINGTQCSIVQVSRQIQQPDNKIAAVDMLRTDSSKGLLKHLIEINDSDTATADIIDLNQQEKAPEPEPELEIISKKTMVKMLESFLDNVRINGDIDEQQVGNLEIKKEQDFDAIAVIEDKTRELEEMKKLVVEAQETIIKLLTDRVEDRARIATLETELKLLPDLQAQADRAMAISFKAEEFKSELHKIKYELEHYRYANTRAKEHRKWNGWVSTVKKWFLKAQGIKQREFSQKI